MPPEIQPEGSQSNVFTPLTKVTPLSKYLALALFIVLPIITLYLGAQFGPVEYVEVEKVVYRDVEKAVPAAPTYEFDAAALRVESALTAPSNLAQSTVYLDGVVPTLTSAVALVSGDCNVTLGASDALLETYPSLVSFIPDIHLVQESASCWVAGGGSYLYLVATTDFVRLIGLPVGECGNLLKTECSGFGEPQVLYEMNSDGVVTKPYSGEPFSG
jgi:hypothetical protein